MKKSRKKSRPDERTEDGKFKTGATQGPGRGPKKGAPNAGRPPSEFKLAMRGLASRKAVMDRLRQLTSGAKSVSDDVFLKAFKEVTDRGYGKAVQPLEHSGPEGEPIAVETADGALERILSELGSIASRKRAGTDP